MMVPLSKNKIVNTKTSYDTRGLTAFHNHISRRLMINSTHRRTNSADLFSLSIPSQNISSLSSLTCSICLLPMSRPTILPCQHRFCYRCLENHQQIRSGSLPLHCNNNFMSNDNRSTTIICQKCSRIHRIHSLDDLEEDHSMSLLISTLLCEQCDELSTTSQLDTCSTCYSVLCEKCYQPHVNSHQNQLAQLNVNEILDSRKENESLDQNSGPLIQAIDTSSNENLFHNRSFDKKSEAKMSSGMCEISSTDQRENNTKKSHCIFRKIIANSRYQTSVSEDFFKDSIDRKPTTIKRSSVLRARRNKICISISKEKISIIDTKSSTLPATPIGRFRNLFDQYKTVEQRIKSYKQRQSELERVVSKLIEVFTLKINQNLIRISEEWKFIKQIILDEIQSKTNRLYFFGYLWKSCCMITDSKQQYQSYFEDNDEIKAGLQVLLTTLTIIKQQDSIATISHLFDREQQATIRNQRRHFDSLICSYSEELSFIVERIHCHNTRFTNWKNSNTDDLNSIADEWDQTVKHDYLLLIEKISNDFVSDVPEVEKLLLQMLMNMKKRLILMNTSEPIDRTKTM